MTTQERKARRAQDVLRTPTQIDCGSHHWVVRYSWDGYLVTASTHHAYHADPPTTYSAIGATREEALAALMPQLEAPNAAIRAAQR